MASLVSLPVLFFSTRYYLRYAAPGYRRERMSYAAMSGSVAETAEGARTIDAHRLGPRQVTRIEDNVRESFYSEMYTLLMRMVWFPTVEGAFAVAVAVDARLERMARHQRARLDRGRHDRDPLRRADQRSARPHRLVARRNSDRPDGARATGRRLGRAATIDPRAGRSRRMRPSPWTTCTTPTAPVTTS